MTPARTAHDPVRFWFRWLMVPPAAYAGFVAGIWLGLALYELADGQCPRNERVSGFCMSWWAAYAHEAALAAGAIVGAGLVVALPWAMAPRFKRVVAALAFAAGFAFVAALTGFGTSDVVLFDAATASGLLALVAIHWKTRPR